MVLMLPLICNAQKINAQIVLNDAQILLSPHEFYVAGVVDEREDKGTVAQLITPGQGAGTPVKYSADLIGGVQSSVKKYLNSSLSIDKALRPVVIHIKRLKVDETEQPNGRVDGKLAIMLSFYLKKDGEDAHLVDYRGGSNYTRTNTQQMDLPGLIGNSLQAGLVYFNTWINKQAGTNIKLAKSVKLIFSDYTEQPEGDTIYYNRKRPLTWDDFQQKPPNSKYEAEVFPSIGYSEQVDVVDGVVLVKLALKPYLPKSAAWAKANARNPYSLNHEQRHFDIVKLVMEHFKQQLLKEKFTADNYDGPINVQYLESFHEMNILQDQYDKETDHGINRYMQAQWNERIDKELQMNGF
jgi:hypothetical protein